MDKYDEEVLEAWNAGRLTPRELVKPFRSQIRDKMKEAFGVKRNAVHFYWLERTLSLLRGKVQFRSPDDFVSWGIYRNNSSAYYRVERAVLALPTPEDEGTEDVWDINEDDFAISSPTIELVEFPGAGFSAASLAGSLEVTAEGLSALASGIDGLTPSQARLATLRLLGGLSLDEIAERDGRILKLVENEWRSVYEWLSSRPMSSNEQQLTSATLVRLQGPDKALMKAITNNPAILATLDWRTFEKILAESLASLGFEVELQKGTKDGGVDIIALRRDGTFGAHRYLLQAKRWSRPVGIEPVREVLFLHDHYRATKSCLATTSAFTKGASTLANQYRWQLELKDYVKLQEWVQSAINGAALGARNG